jgi:hypothetical protein
VTSPADGTAARAKHLRLVDPATDHPSARALIDEGRALDTLATTAAGAEHAVAMAEEANDPNALGHALNALAAVRSRRIDCSTRRSSEARAPPIRGSRST